MDFSSASMPELKALMEVLSSAVENDDADGAPLREESGEAEPEALTVARSLLASVEAAFLARLGVVALAA